MTANKVLTYHTNVLTCGVAKFNSIMAGFLKVKCNQIFDKDSFSKDSFPIVSVKIGEFLDQDKKRLTREIAKLDNSRFDLFLHGYEEDPLELLLIKKARKVFTGNISIATKIKKIRSDIKELWCPGMNLNNTEFEKTDIKLLTFGMAHKLKVDLYYKLKEILDKSQKTYSLYISYIFPVYEPGHTCRLHSRALWATCCTPEVEDAHLVDLAPACKLQVNGRQLRG